mmetsp:Transcript_2070/g.1956  ORF Transcript_2070/g.1956 Transcript_2070/m.1956 type:complete len:84 (+) Transcript_2070:137-388(+)
MIIKRNSCETNPKKSASKARETLKPKRPLHSSIERVNSPVTSKTNKPTKGGLGHYKKDLTIDPYSLQKSHQLKNLYTKDSSKI